MRLIAIFSISAETGRQAPGEIRRQLSLCCFFPSRGIFRSSLRLHLQQLPVFRAIVTWICWIKYRRARGRTPGFAFRLQQWARIGLCVWVGRKKLLNYAAVRTMQQFSTFMALLLCYLLCRTVDSAHTTVRTRPDISKYKLERKCYTELKEQCLNFHNLMVLLSKCF